jgi:hypothetical protein
MRRSLRRADGQTSCLGKANVFLSRRKSGAAVHMNLRRLNAFTSVHFSGARHAQRRPRGSCPAVASPCASGTQAGVSAETHYHIYGWKEGRNPDALFLGYPYAEGPAYGCG